MYGVRFGSWEYRLTLFKAQIQALAVCQKAAAPLVSLGELPKGAGTHLNFCSCLLWLVWADALWTGFLSNHCCTACDWSSVHLQDLQQDWLQVLRTMEKGRFFSGFFWGGGGRGECETIFHEMKTFFKIIRSLPLWFDLLDGRRGMWKE